MHTRSGNRHSVKQRLLLPLSARKLRSTRENSADRYVGTPPRKMLIHLPLLHQKICFFVLKSLKYSPLTIFLVSFKDRCITVNCYIFNMVSSIFYNIYSHLFFIILFSVFYLYFYNFISLIYIFIFFNIFFIIFVHL